MAPMPSNEGTALELRDYVRVLWSRKLLVVLATVVMVGSTYALSVRQPEVYEASTEFLLQPQVSESVGESARVSQSIGTQVAVLQSAPVRQRVREKLGVAPEVEVNAKGGTEIIRVTAESSDPDQAALIANAYVEAYVDHRRQQAVDELLRVSSEIQVRVDDLQAQIDELNQQVADAPISQQLVVEETVAGGRARLESRQALYRSQLDDLQLRVPLTGGGAEVIFPATPPSSPARPTPVRNALLALPVGLVFGMALAFFFEYLDDSIRSKEDLERATGRTLPVLGLIPKVSWKDRRTTQIVALDQPGSPAAEAYRSLRTAVQFLGVGHPMGCIQITSAVAGEGKSTTMANLAVVLARAGERVVVVDCDMRRPRLHEFFGLPNTIGFTSVLLGDVPLSGAIQPSGEAGIEVLTMGPIPPNPSELLASRRTAEVLASLRADGTTVLIDSAPVLPVTDAIVVSKWVDATLLVAASGLTTRKQVHRALELLNQVEGPVVGTIFNQVDSEADGYGVAGGYYTKPRSRRWEARDRVAATQ